MADRRISFSSRTFAIPMAADTPSAATAPAPQKCEVSHLRMWTCTPAIPQTS